MTESTPDQILARAQVPSANGRPVRKDEIELHDRGLYIESWLPERRSRRKPLLFVHGELAGSWLWERTADPLGLTFTTYVDDVVAAVNRLGPTTVVIGHGMGGLLALKAAEQVPIGGLVLVAPELPGELRPTAQPHELRDVPDVYGRGRIGWATLPEKLQRDHRDLTLADVLRIQHLLGQKPHESGRAMRTVLTGVSVDPRPFAEIPRLVVGGGLDRQVP